jgi:hypothetical protein
LTSADPSTVDLYLGDDDQYVKIEKNHGDVVIGTGVVGVPTGIADLINQGGWDQGSYINTATTGGSGTGLTVDVAGGGGYIALGNITINNSGTGYTVGDVITINNENDLPATFVISTVTNSSNNWTFSNTGAITFPDATVQTTAYTGSTSTLVNGTSTVSLSSTGTVTFPDGTVQTTAYSSVYTGWFKAAGTVVQLDTLLARINSTGTMQISSTIVETIGDGAAFAWNGVRNQGATMSAFGQGGTNWVMPGDWLDISATPLDNNFEVATVSVFKLGGTGSLYRITYVGSTNNGWSVVIERVAKG